MYLSSFFSLRLMLHVVNENKLTSLNLIKKICYYNVEI